MLTIGRAAAQLGVSADTLRYYEKEGLLPLARKSKSGYRLYNQDDLRRIGFIRKAQRTGFSLDEIKDLLKLRTDGSACCRDVRSIAIQKRLDIEHKIRALQSMSQSLVSLIEVCREDSGPLDHCPILSALDQGIECEARRV